MRSPEVPRVRSKRLFAVPFVLLACTALLLWAAALDCARAAASVASVLGAGSQAPSAAALAEGAAALGAAGEPGDAGEGASVAPFPLWGEPLGRLEVPSAGISADVLQGDGMDELEAGIGHSFASALPGEAGRCVLSAHNSSFFATLGRASVGDEVVWSAPWGLYRYRVADTFVFDERDASVLVGDEGRLLLYTCHPFDQLGVTPERYGVLCDLVEGPEASWL